MKPATARFILGWATSVVALLLAGCNPGSHPPAPANSSAIGLTPSSQPAQPAEKTSAAAPASGDSACEHATVSPQQLAGDWTESGDATITTLSAGGKLKSSGGNDNQSGTWSYLPWAQTPGKDAMPPGQENTCVLWLHWELPGPPMDLVYVPLKATSTSLELSYVGRGNTLIWTRPKSAS